MVAHFYTLGCKVNMYETQGLREAFASNGFVCDQSLPPDVVVLNSCTVTGIADKKSRQLLRRQRREHPHAVVVLCGCMAQSLESPDLLPEANIIVGTRDKQQILSLVKQYLMKKTPLFHVEPLQDAPFEEYAVSHFDDSFQRAYLKIEDGCDCFCSYCAIPLVRGAVRSRPLADISREVQSLVDNGYREIVLVGINLSRYGHDLGHTLADAVHTACACSGEYRIRLGSVEPVLIDSGQYARMATEKRLCPQFHLALQSGCDETLLRMGRRYTTAQYRQTVADIFSLFDNPSITTDIIVGFPGETQEEFDHTCAFVGSLPLLRAHIFEYSRRQNTLADKLPDQIGPQIKAQRAQILTAICRQKAAEFFETQVGKTATVLTEAKIGGYTEQYMQVFFEQKHPAGQLVQVRLTAVTEGGCKAELL